MEFEIRQAKVRDAKALAHLCGTVQRLHAQARPQIYKPYVENDQKLIDWYIHFLRHRPSIGFIAESSETPVGYVLGITGESDETAFTYPRTYLHIDQMSVDEAWQRSGVGSALMERILQYAQEIDVQMVSLDVAEFNTAALEFYKRHDFEFRFHSMGRLLVQHG